MSDRRTTFVDLRAAYETTPPSASQPSSSLRRGEPRRESYDLEPLSDGPSKSRNSGWSLGRAAALVVVAACLVSLVSHVVQLTGSLREEVAAMQHNAEVTDASARAMLQALHALQTTLDNAKVVGPDGEESVPELKLSAPVSCSWGRDAQDRSTGPGDRRGDGHWPLHVHSSHRHSLNRGSSRAEDDVDPPDVEDGEQGDSGLGMELHAEMLEDTYRRRMLGMVLLLMSAVVVLSIRLIDHMPFFVQWPVARFMHIDLNSMQGASLYNLVAYRMDFWFSTHPYSKILALLWMTCVLIFLGSIGMYLVGRASMYDAFWAAVEGVGINWSFYDEDGADAADGGYASLRMRLMALVVSIGGTMVTAMTLGLVSDGLSSKIEDWKKGKSDVLESGHTLVLGWSDKVMPILEQVCAANAWKGGKTIVVQSELGKAAMEEEIEGNRFDLCGSKIICRGVLAGRSPSMRPWLQARRWVVLVSGAGVWCWRVALLRGASVHRAVASLLWGGD